MRTSLFQDVDILYRKSNSTLVTRHRIEHLALGRYCVGLDRFHSRLNNLVCEDYWRKFLIPLKRLRFELCAAPFPQDYRLNRISTILEELQYHLRFCQRLYPDLTESAVTILDLLKELLEDPRDRLLEKLVELTSTEEKVAWVIKESRLIPYVEDLVSNFNLRDLSPIHPLQLKNLCCYDQLLIIGPSCWFPESVFTAPRADRIGILIFDWIKDRWKPQNVFVSPHKSSGGSNRKYITIQEHETSNRWDYIDPENLLQIVDRALSMISNLNEEKLDEYEGVVARCIFLEGDWAVFIEASEGAKTLVIDPDEDTDDRIARVFVKDIKRGMFILVRTGGGGDYIVPVADKIMGDEAQHARACQKRWKELLRSHVKRNGLLETSVDLLDLGSDVANEVNVRSWMAPRSIRTRKYNDFEAIMKLVGLEDEAQEYWTIMECINRAHHKAGFEIRNLLFDQVKDLNMEELQKRGKMHFKLSGEDEGGLTAFRVESILAETIEVPYSRIGQPFKLEDQLWRE